MTEVVMIADVDGRRVFARRMASSSQEGSGFVVKDSGSSCSGSSCAKGSSC